MFQVIFQKSIMQENSDKKPTSIEKSKQKNHSNDKFDSQQSSINEISKDQFRQPKVKKNFRITTLIAKSNKNKKDNFQILLNELLLLFLVMYQKHQLLLVSLSHLNEQFVFLL
mgnify:CR=1 FL=1